MNIDGYSHEILRQISPQKIRLYLSSCGWVPDGKTKFYDIFTNPEDNTVVTVPNNRDYDDYVYRVDEIVRSVSESQRISIQRVITGMTVSSSMDTIEYHYEPESGEVGLIPISDVIRIINAGNDLNNYAYRDCMEFRPSYATSNWRGRRDLEAIKLGPTIPGSYVVQFVYPIMDASEGAQANLEGGVVPGRVDLRTICDKIESSLETIIDAAERNRTYLDEDDQISHNFVSSVMDLGFEKAEVNVRRVRLSGKDWDVPKPKIISRDIMPRIAAIEAAMRPEEMRVEQDFIGRITLFRDLRETVTDEPVDVAITFIDVEGKACSATLTLSGEDLDSAYDASKARSNVRVSGTLVGGRHRRIVDVKGFSVIGRGRSSTAWIARFKTHQYHGSYQKFLNRDFFFDQGPILHAEMSISRVSAVFFLD